MVTDEGVTVSVTTPALLDTAVAGFESWYLREHPKVLKWPGWNGSRRDQDPAHLGVQSWTETTPTTANAGERSTIYGMPDSL